VKEAINVLARRDCFSQLLAEACGIRDDLSKQVAEGVSFSNLREGKFHNLSFGMIKAKI